MTYPLINASTDGRELDIVVDPNEDSQRESFPDGMIFNWFICCSSISELFKLQSQLNGDSIKIL